MLPSASPSPGTFIVVTNSSLFLALRRLKWRLAQVMRVPSPDSFSEIDIIHRLLVHETRADGFMIDVGAHFGESFYPFRLFNWRVLAFEPDPDPRKQIALATLADARVTIVALAVSDREEEGVPFFTSDESTGISSLSAFRASHRETARVRVSTLACELAQRGIDRVDFLKVDTEGNDLFVLRGFPWTDPQLRPRVVLCEFEDSKTTRLGYEWNEMADFLRQLGHAVFVSEWHPIERYGIRHRWRKISRYPASLVDRNAWGNLVAFRSERDAMRFEALAKGYSAT